MHLKIPCRNRSTTSRSSREIRPVHPVSAGPPLLLCLVLTYAPLALFALVSDIQTIDCDAKRNLPADEYLSSGIISHQHVLLEEL